jgi:hypothetical protein
VSTFFLLNSVDHPRTMHRSLWISALTLMGNGWLLLPFLSVQHYLQSSLGLHVCKGIWIGQTLDKLQFRSLLLNLAVQPRRVQGGRIKTQDYFAILGQEIWKTPQDLAVILCGDETVLLKSRRIYNDCVVRTWSSFVARAISHPSRSEKSMRVDCKSSRD